MFDNQLPMCLAITNSARSYQRRANYLMTILGAEHSLFSWVLRNYHRNQNLASVNSKARMY